MAEGVSVLASLIADYLVKYTFGLLISKDCDIQLVKRYVLTINNNNYFCINSDKLSLTIVAPYIPRSPAVVSHFRALPREV
jgi:hypothetical protein